jgi:hypothetical protein
MPDNGTVMPVVASHKRISLTQVDALDQKTHRYSKSGFI